MATSTAIFLVLAAVHFHPCLAVEVPAITLKNAAEPGMKMPVVGIGTCGYGPPGETWTNEVAEKAVGQWLRLGGRRIDESYSYRNQVGAGKAIKASDVAREDIFVVSKADGFGYNDTMMQLQPILDTLGVDYVDLLLVHWPGSPSWSTDPACQGNPTTWRACRQATWKVMEEIHKMGKARAIGVANFEKNHIEDIVAMNSLLPAVNQVEFHPYWHEDDLVAYCKSQDIAFNGYSPLGCPDWAPTSRKWNHTILEEPAIVRIARSYNRTPAQVILRWEWQQGVLVQPRTLKPEHMKENLNYFDFELTSDEMSQISNIKPPTYPKVCPDPHNIK